MTNNNMSNDDSDAQWREHEKICHNITFLREYPSCFRKAILKHDGYSWSKINIS